MIWLWVGFIVFVLLMLALDLGVFHRHAHVITVKEAVGWSTVWIMLGLSFSVFVYYGYENHWLGLGSSIDAADGVINDGNDTYKTYASGVVLVDTKPPAEAALSLPVAECPPNTTAV